MKCGLTKTETGTSAEFKSMFEALQKCLDLRDKYIRLSQQRLGDDPRHHDGMFAGFKGDAGDVSGIKLHVSSCELVPPSGDTHSSWKIYPSPPPPHWHYKKPSTDFFPEDEEFDFSKCDIPGEGSWTFKIDEKGVYQVYDSSAGMLILEYIFPS